MKPSPVPRDKWVWNQIQSYKPEVVQAAQETKHQTTAYSDPSCLQARACKVLEEDTTTLQERY